jgi:serine/threonine-protein kinase
LGVVVRDRSGEIVQTIGSAIPSVGDPVVSPDGRRVALRVVTDVWVYEIERNVGVRLTPGGVAFRPAWLPSGREVAYYTAVGARFVTQSADGGSTAAVWLEPAVSDDRISFSSDGRYATYSSSDPDGGVAGIWYREAGPERSFSKPIAWLRTPALENQPQFAPNGRYVAYRSNESGRYEIYVRPFPKGPDKWLVSTNGGIQPTWSANGRELFYIADAALMAAPVSTEGGFTVGEPRRLFESPDLRAVMNSFLYDVFPDGQRFVMLHRDENALGEAVRVVQNWDAAFRNHEQD